MKSIKEAIDFQHINRQFTNLVDLDEILRRNYSRNFSKVLESYEIDYENSIPLIKVVEKFNEFYVAFMEDLKKLPKLDLAYETDVLDYCEESGAKFLRLFLYSHNFREIYDGNAELIITKYENDENIEAKVVKSDGWKPIIDATMVEGCNKEIFKQYLDLFSKHKNLIYIYIVLSYGDWASRKALYNNLGISLSLSVDRDWNLYEGLNDVYFYLSYYDMFVKIPFKFGKDFKIDYDNCKALLTDDKYYDLPKEAYDEFVNEIYINKGYIARKEYPKCKKEENFQRDRTK